MLMCGHNDLVGSSVSTYLKNKNAKVTSVPWQLMMDDSSRYRHRTMIFNIISHEHSCADFVSYLNKNRCKVYDHAVVIITDSDMAKLCIELLYVEKFIVLTDRSPLCDFGRLTTTDQWHLEPAFIPLTKKTDRPRTANSLSSGERLFA